MEPLDKGNTGENLNSLVLPFVERLSSSIETIRRTLCAVSLVERFFFNTLSLSWRARALPEVLLYTLEDSTKGFCCQFARGGDWYIFLANIANKLLNTQHMISQCECGSCGLQSYESYC